MLRVGVLPALLWKHAIVRYRKWIRTLLEVVLPILPLLGFLYIYHKIGGDADNSKHSLTPHHTDHFEISQSFLHSISAIYFAPNNSKFTRDLMQTTAKKLDVLDIHGFQSEKDLLLSVGKSLETHHFHVAVIFENVANDSIPDSLNYTIRNAGLYHTDRVTPLLQVAGSHEQYAWTYYLFVTLKTNLDSVYIDMKAGRDVRMMDHICIQSFPYPAYNPDLMWKIKYGFLIPSMVLIGCMVPMLITIERVLIDKASGIKDLLKMIGVRSDLLWLSHYINCWAALVPVSVVLFILMVCINIGHSHHPLVPLSSPLIIFISLILYVNYVILFAFAITTVFSKGLLGTIVGAMLWIVSVIVNISYLNEMSTWIAVLFNFIPNYSFFAIFYTIGLQETREIGLHWKNLFSATPEFPLSCGAIWILLLVQQGLLVLFIWYMDKVNPGPYGIAEPFAFPLKYILKKVSPDTPALLPVETTDSGPDFYFETAPTDADVGIAIKNVWKVYEGGGAKKIALKGVTMDLYMQGITVLLGHNGAGKTTLMSIITGLTNTTAGCVVLKKDSGIGLCPQHNLTIPELTLHQHLLLFGFLKGMTIEDANREARSVAESLQLSEKLHWICGQLSGGQRRRAQLGLALMGSPHILVLDEPTTGLDPISRRQLWDILLEIKNKHTILISSHSMEEADILADRVAILDHGRLKCLGTPIFLKKTFSTGYTVKVITEGGEDIEKEIGQIVSSSGVEVEQLPKDGSLLSYRLLSHHTHMLPGLFDKLEREKQRLDITSIGLSLTTLEEVFLKVTEGCTPVQDTPTITIELGESNTDKFLTGTQLFFSQYYGLLIRKILYFMSVKKSLILQIFLALFMFAAPLMGSKEQDEAGSPPLNINPSIFPHQPLTVPHNLPNEYTPYLLTLGTYYNMHLKTVADPYDYIIEEGEKDPKLSFTRSLIIGMRFIENKVCGMYSTSLYHTLPAVMGLVSNLFAAKNLNGTPPHITTINHPITKGSLSSLVNDDLEAYDISNWASCVILGYFFLLGIFLSLPVKERAGGQRHLLQLAGPGPFTYWFMSLLTDIAFVLPISTIFFLVTTYFYPAEAMNLNRIIVPALLLVWLHVLASICFIYMLSLIFDSPARAYITFFILTLFIGIMASVGSYYATLLLPNDDHSIGFVSGLLCLLVPSFALENGLIRVAMLSKDNLFCEQSSAKFHLDTPCCEKKDDECIGLGDPYTHKVNGIYVYIVFLIASSIFYMCLLLLIEYKRIHKIWEWSMNRMYHPKQQQGTEEEVHREKKKVHEEAWGMSPQKSQVLVHGLCKIYRRFPFIKGHEAVRDLSFSIEKGECFGLLGANGAGKTTTFNILSGLQVATKGSCYFKGKSKASIGYCPQFDALDLFLTGNQILELFNRLRGIPQKSLSSKVSTMLEGAALTEYGDVPCGKYSGGTRRRLSTVVALGAAHYGGDCVLLDEPSAGVDPHSRQSLHSLIQDSRFKGHCLVLSSHSMEECDKLVSRLGILRKGELVCLGMPQNLKHKYSSGYLLTLRLRPHPSPVSSEDAVDSPSSENLTQLDSLQSSNNVAKLKTAVTDKFVCTLKDQHLTVLQYHIEEKDCLYSTLFTRMENLKIRHDDILEDYTISDTTLEQVFLHMSREDDPNV